jgi:hypothetical protein
MPGQEMPKFREVDVEELEADPDLFGKLLSGKAPIAIHDGVEPMGFLFPVKVDEVPVD